MRLKRLAVLGVAILAAGSAAILAVNLTKKEKVPSRTVETVAQDIPEIKFLEILIADRGVAIGSRLSTSMVRWQKWPEGIATEGYIVRGRDSDIKEIVSESIARSAFAEGEPIRKNKLIKSDSGYMSALLPGGQRAVAIPISTDTGAGGFILPDDRVDVIMTRRDPSDDGKKFLTETILKNIRVLAIDQTVDEKDGESTVVGSTATLQFTPRQAEIITVSQELADRITLSLRSLEDRKDTNVSDADYLLSGNRKGKIRVIRFGKAKEIIIKNN